LRIWRAMMRYGSRIEIGWTWNITKAQISAAVDATDQWIDDNQAAYNTALPAAFRNNATQAQKTVLFCAVALMRIGIDWLRGIFGEVD